MCIDSHNRESDKNKLRVSSTVSKYDKRTLYTAPTTMKFDVG